MKLSSSPSSGQCKDLCQHIIVTESLSLDRLICRCEYCLFNFLVFPVTDKDYVSVSRLIRHQVSNRTSYYGSGLGVLRDCIQKLFQIGQDLSGRPRGSQTVDANG
jgi:hypothetical protein